MLLKDDVLFDITVADNGNMTVVVNSEDYSGKGWSLLADMGTCTRLAKEPTVV